MTRTKSIVLVLLAGLLGVGFSPATSFADSDSTDNAPEVVIPATGGAPELATPAGGDTYIPVSGGAPIVGTAT